jgi:hypothetical protein
VPSALKQVQSQLGQLTSGICQRDIVGNEVDTISNVASPVAGTVGGVLKPVVGTVGGAVGTVEGTVKNTLPDTTNSMCSLFPPFLSLRSLMCVVVVGVKRQVGQVGQLTTVATTLVSQVKDRKFLDVSQTSKVL